MKPIKIALLAVLSISLIFSSCKKKESDPVPALSLKSFSFPATTNLEVEFSWTVNGKAAGNDYVDLDVLVDTAGGNYSDAPYGSDDEDEFEAFSIPSSAKNKTYTIGLMYWENEALISTLTSPYTIVYTLKVYPTGDPSKAQTFSGSFTNPSTIPSEDIVYNQMSIVKNASTYTFTELSPKTTTTMPEDAQTINNARIYSKK